MNNNFVNNSSFLLQLYSVLLLLQDFNNTDLMQEFETQNEILTLLRKEDNNAREVRKED